MKSSNSKKILIVLLVLVYIICSLGTILGLSLVPRTYDLKTKWESGCDVSVTMEQSGIVEYQGFTENDGIYNIEFKGVKKGETTVDITLTPKDGSEGKYTFGSNFKVNSHKVVYDNSGDGVGIDNWPLFLLVQAIFFTIFTILLIRYFAGLIRRELFSHRTVFTLFSIFLMAGFAIMFIFGTAYPMLYTADVRSSTIFELITYFLPLVCYAVMPLVGIFFFTVGVSNVVLILREGFRPVNMLGIFLGLFLLIGTLVNMIYMYMADRTLKSAEIVLNIMSLGIIAIELMLLSIAICALVAVKKKQSYDKDYIIILGCGIRKDGTLYPLLKGRADAAIAFYKKQAEETGKKLFLVPSGGKGNDEIIAEGEAIKRYLISEGIPEEQIIAETESKTTWENMTFSKKKIDERIENAKGLFATTNYHVFRAGLFAKDAGLDAEGIGSKTKWYFWPNAFLREFAAVLVSCKKSVVILAVLFILLVVMIIDLPEIFNLLMLK